MEINFLGLSAHLSTLLAFNGFQYIYDLRKENSAINKFMQDGFSADYVVELIGKLIQIKKHSKLSKEVFWQGCAINIADAYSYRVKIETVWNSAFMVNGMPKTVNGENAAVSVAPAKQEVISIEPKSNQKINWKGFLEWTKRSLSSSSILFFKNLVVEELDSEIKILDKISPNHQTMISNFFSESGVEIIFRRE